MSKLLINIDPGGSTSGRNSVETSGASGAVSEHDHKSFTSQVETDSPTGIVHPNLSTEWKECFVLPPVLFAAAGISCDLKPLSVEIPGKCEAILSETNPNELYLNPPGSDLDNGGSTEAHSFPAILDKSESKVVLLEGPASVGKTTLIKRLVFGFETKACLDKYSHLLVCNLSDPSVCEATTVEELTKLSGLTEPKITSFQEMSSGINGNKLLIMLDNFPENLEPNSLINSILGRKIFPESTIVLSSRLADVESIKSRTKVDYHYKLKGFSPAGVEHYLRSNTPRRYRKSVLNFLIQNRLLKFCENPLVCSITLKIFKEQRYSIPKTLTAFLYKLVARLVLNGLDSDEKSSLASSNPIQLECLPESAQSALDAMSQLAMKHLLTGHLCTNRVDSRNFLSSFALKLPTIALEKSFRFGLVELSSEIDDGPAAYKFIDQSVIELLAALHLHKQPPINQLHFLYKNAQELLNNGFKLWLKFFFGLTTEDYIQHVNYNPTKLMMSTVIDVLVDCLDLISHKEHRSTLVDCIHEAQEPSMLRKLASRHPAVLTFSIPTDEFESLINPVSTLINKSGSTNWEVTASPTHEALVGQLKSLTPKALIIHVKESQDDSLLLSPRLDSSSVEKMIRQAERLSFVKIPEEKAEKLNSFCCRAIREVLQRVLPLYSEVKLKGDASNVSYVSFLSCKCFETSFKEHVTLFPTQPVHYLDVKPKKRYATASLESLTDTDRHNIENHEGHAVEIVIMLKPFLRKIQCVVPGSNEEFSVMISGELSSEVAQETSSAGVDGEVIAVQRCIDDYVFKGEHTEMIAPSLPVVQKTSRSQPAHPSAALPPATLPSLAPVEAVLPTVIEEEPLDSSRGNSSKNDSVQPTTTPRIQEPSPRHESYQHVQGNFSPVSSQPQVPRPAETQSKPYHLLPRLNSASNRMSSDRSRHLQHVSTALTAGNTSTQGSYAPLVQPFAEQADQTSRKQTSLRPGTVLFTSVPDKIPSDRVHQLPNQRHLIRRGGNGAIYSEIVSGMTLAVKKTSYRAKEYAVVTKLRHKNILPLLAYIWGEENPENKRRFFVYHYLPKLTGDLARMVTDKEELSISKFHEVHRHNPRAMGLAVGNLKYLLSQVLRGLSYMHSLHIAHRDIKASNVLLKFFCNCETPLHCGCDVKYQVVLCDFDAAIELDALDRIPITHPTSSHSVTTPQVHVVPVGTNGFRAPECSMLTVANTPEALSPPVTTKVDVFSFGIVSLRLMISTDTPHTQRAMALMILHYHQQKRLTEGRIGSRRQSFLKVPKEKIDTLLKLPKLKSRVSWLHGAYDFVSKSLSVDPDSRPATSALLEHPFLN